ncbi:MAG TPA: hypothetical protein VFE05_19860 [Longimicrobiaceae bacterium]|jgi:hypothetical protein|nr:hypothetical protein [Longimicrobiaceae bacterium]
MVKSISRVVAGGLVLAASLVGFRTELHAQGPVRGPVDVVLPDSFPEPSAEVLVMRFESGKTDVIVLPADATPQALGAGLALLRRERRTHARAEHDQVLIVQGFVAPSRLPAPTLEALASKLAEVRATPQSQVGNLGTGRWVELPDANVHP